METETVALNGIEMFCEIDGAGEPLLLLHGGTGCHEDWIHAGRDRFLREYKLIIPDARGHGRSTNPARTITHRQCALDTLALLDHFGIERCRAIGLSMGANILLHMATRQPQRIHAMVLVSATPYFPAQARPIMSQYADRLPEEQCEILRRSHPGGEAQIQALLASSKAFATSYDDMTFTPPYLSTIQARTLIVQGDRDPLYPVELSVEMARAIPQSSLWIVPNAGHGPVIGERWPEFLKIAASFLRQ